MSSSSRDIVPNKELRLDSSNSGSVTKHWVYVPTVDPEIMRQAKHWVDAQNTRDLGKNYELISHQNALAAFCTNEIIKPKGLLQKVLKEHTLYIYCHGYIDESHKPTGEIGGYTFYLSAGKKTKKEVKLTPSMLAEHLENEGLSFELKKMKLFACYSSEFVPLLSEAMCKKWPDLEVYGYQGETLPAGTNHHKVAGLSHEEAEAYFEGNKEVMTKEKEGVFRAKLHRVGFRSGKKIEFEKIDEEKKLESAIETLSNLKLK